MQPYFLFMASPSAAGGRERYRFGEGADSVSGSRVLVYTSGGNAKITFGFIEVGPR